MSEEKKVEEDAQDGDYRTPTASEWLKKVDEDMATLRKSPYELEEQRKLTVEGYVLACAIDHLREAVMSLAMDVVQLKSELEVATHTPAGGKKSMGRTKS